MEGSYKKPRNKAVCERMIMDSMPPLDHKYGYYRESAEEYASRWSIPKEKLWACYKAETVVKDHKRGRVIYYPEDIARAVKMALCKSWVKPSEWD